MSDIEVLRTMEAKLQEVDIFAKHLDAHTNDHPVSHYIQEAINHVYRRMKWGAEDGHWVLTEREKEKIK